jgi:MarR family transcriptional regulator, organic hydroperoxide resistance regulator
MSAAPTPQPPHQPHLGDLIGAERDIVAKLDAVDLDVDYEALAVVSNIFRVAAMARRRIEQDALAPERLSWTAFTTLWVLWIWGEMESRHLAAEANISKGTLTGVLDTLEGRGLVARRRRTSDRRLVMVALTDEGAEVIARVFPTVNSTEVEVAAHLSSRQRRAMAAGLRAMVRGLAER